MMREFLWNRDHDSKSDHLVSWAKVCLSKKKGGLGIGKLLIRNKALILKWLCRFPQEKDALWHKMIKSKYGLASNSWDSKIASRTTYRSPWKFILKQYDIFYKMVAFKVGNGDNIRFREDAWRGEDAFINRFPTLYRLSSLHNGKISDFRVRHGAESLSASGWNFHFIRGISERKLDDMVELLKCVTNVNLSVPLEDRREWLPAKNGGFSFKSCFHKLQEMEGLADFAPYHLVWKTPSPTKI
ncbi:hypothetical protein TorRG33x02_179430, partial [Trema orientale]